MIDVMTSIAIYLGVFGLSFFMFWKNESQCLNEGPHHTIEKRKAITLHLRQNIWAITGILLLSLLAGLRGDGVGVDVTVYPDAFLQSAASYGSFFDFLGDPVMQPASEPLHALLVWLCSRVTVEKGLLLFFYQLLTVTPVYCALYQMRNRMPISMGMAVYMLFFYNNSLNMMRQSVSCAFLLLAFSYLLAMRTKFSWKAVLFAAVAVLFHRSGIYGLILLLCASPLGLTSRKRIRAVAYLVIVISPAILIAILRMLAINGFHDSHIEYYYNVFIAKTVNVDWFINPFGLPSLAYLVMYSWLVFLPQLLSLLFDETGRLSHLCDVRERFLGLFQRYGKRFSKRAVPLFSRQNYVGKRFSSTFNQSVQLSAYLHNLNVVGYLIYVAVLFAVQTVYGIRVSLYFDFFLTLSISLACSGDNSRNKKALVITSLVCIWLVWIIRLGWSGSQTYLFFFQQGL